MITIEHTPRGGLRLPEKCRDAESHELAADALKAALDYNRRNVDQCAIARCYHCGGWHLECLVDVRPKVWRRH